MVRCVTHLQRYQQCMAQLLQCINLDTRSFQKAAKLKVGCCLSTRELLCWQAAMGSQFCPFATAAVGADPV